MMARMTLKTIIFSACMLSASPLIAATFYVAPSGNNANPGTIGQPWATLQHAAGQIGPGDELLIRAGQYAGMHLTTSGTAGQPIAIRAFEQELVIINGDNPITPDGVNLEGASYVTVEGLRVEGVTRAGLRAVLCEHVTMRNNVLVDNGRWGILTGFCDDLLIENNLASGSIDEHGIYVSNSSDRPIIRGNVIFDNNANGIHMNGDINVGGGDGIISDALVENNIIYNNGSAGGSGINMDGVQDSLIRNNLIYASHASGISLFQIDGGGPSTNNRVLNNTVMVASDGRWALNIRIGSSGNKAFNNVFYNAHSFRGSISIDPAALTDFESDYNLVMQRFTLDDGNSVINLTQWQNQTGQDLNSIVASPAAIFVAPDQADFFPLEGGLLIDTGTHLPDVAQDLLGNPRPIGSSHDIGAYEWFMALFADRFEK